MNHSRNQQLEDQGSILRFLYSLRFLPLSDLGFLRFLPLSDLGFRVPSECVFFM